MSAARPVVALVTYEKLPTLIEDDQLLVKALAEIGIEGRAAIWSDENIAWDSFDALVIRSPWDYFVRPVEFRRWLDARIASGVTLMNPGEVLRWNFDKAYLGELGAKGVELVPTIVVPKGARPDVAALARARGWDDVVVKPTISGGAYLTHRFRVADAAKYAGEIAKTLEDRGLLIQPFLPEIADGELSLLFFDGVFSHAVRKRAAAGDYRVQFQYGGTNEDAEVTAELVEGARRCLAAAPAETVYGRVDGVVREGRFLLMELEIFEPLMFLARHPEAPGRFARAIARRLGR